MKHIIGILFLLPFAAFAQKGAIGNNNYSQEIKRKVSSFYKQDKIGIVSEDAVKNFLVEKEIVSSVIELDLQSFKTSPKGVHYTFSQLINGMPIYHSQIKVNIDKSGNIRSLFDNSYNLQGIMGNKFPSATIINGFINNISGIERFTEESVYFSIVDSFRPVKLLTIWEKNHSNYEVIVGDKGEMLFSKDLNRYFMQDSIVSAKVFFPDPLTSAGQTYGGVYSDNSDADNFELNAERYEINMTVDFLNDTFRLTSPYVEIQEFSGPVTNIAISETPVFDFTRSQDGFEDVNCFYHLNVFKDYMDSLGFLTLVDYQLGVDAHALNGNDNSMYQSQRLYFGEGCVDDAEDADVIIHEYGHAITASAAPNTWVGTERKALDEGTGDYFAASYTRSLNPYNWEKMFGWDGHNVCWPGRTTASLKQYPNDLTGNIHNDGEIWSSTLMQIWEAIGKETTDQITLQSLYSYASNITMTDAAYLFLDADSLLNGGANYLLSYFWFELRGILPSLPVGYDLLAVNTGSTDVLCEGACTGTASVTAYAGMPPYTYLWSDVNAQTSETATGLCAGSVSVIVTDSLGFISTASYNISSPSLLINTINATLDSGNAEGTVSVFVSGGTPPYFYVWDDSLSQSTATASGLVPGIYNVTVTDANGCSLQDNEVVDLYVSNNQPIIEKLQFSVYPNPVENVVQINLRNKNILVDAKLYDSLGKLVFETVFYGSTKVNSNKLSAGAYLLKLNSEQGEFGRQIIIIK